MGYSRVPARLTAKLYTGGLWFGEFATAAASSLSRGKHAIQKDFLILLSVQSIDSSPVGVKKTSQTNSRQLLSCNPEIQSGSGIHVSQAASGSILLARAQHTTFKRVERRTGTNLCIDACIHPFTEINYAEINWSFCAMLGKTLVHVEISMHTPV